MPVTCFDAIDRQIIAGGADRPALVAGDTTWTYARLLEEVAAFGGVLRHCGVRPGDRVDVALPESPEAVVAVLACARIGAEHGVGSGEAHAQVLVTDSTQTDLLAAASAAVVLVKQRPGDEWQLREGQDYDWDVVLRAGRTDPAECVEGATVTPYDERTRQWLEPLLRGGTLELP